MTVAEAPPEPVISLSGIGVRFGGLAALDDVSLDVRENEIVGLIGPNGAGKTTLFNVICGFVRPTSGSGHVKGSPVGKIRPHDLAKIGVARTLQGVGLFRGMSVLDNVMAGGHSKAKTDLASAMAGLPNSSRSEARLKKRALEMLDRLGIADTARTAPGSLPYGLQKKVAIARALMEQPSVLLLDEPASGLSEVEVAEFSALFKSLRSDMSILLVEHNMDFVMPLCELLVVLDFGKVIAVGPPAEIRTNELVLDAYLGNEVESVT